MKFMSNVLLISTDIRFTNYSHMMYIKALVSDATLSSDANMSLLATYISIPILKIKLELIDLNQKWPVQIQI